MTRFRHDLILRLVKIMDAVLVTIPFALCWYLYYAKHIASPFYAKGDYLVVALFFVLFIMFGRVYDAFLMSMYRISEIVYAQFLAAAVSDFIMYIVIWLLSKHLPNILPGVAALVGQLVLAAVWARSAHHAYFKTFPPQATAVIYDTRQGLEKLIGQYDIRSGQGPITIARSMSGGNQQKAIVAREIDKNPELLVAVQPTRGLDVGAIEYIHKQLVAQRDAGKAVLLVSLELDEVMDVPDRILVMYEGEIVGELDPKATTQEELGLYMAGAKRDEVKA